MSGTITFDVTIGIDETEELIATLKAGSLETGCELAMGIAQGLAEMLAHIRSQVAQGVFSGDFTQNPTTIN